MITFLNLSLLSVLAFAVWISILVVPIVVGTVVPVVVRAVLNTLDV